ncbi:MAG: hypothetical protein BWZ08_02833 [candidate division BRC1 bacterium ADurb.BinA292]|nr:MAG: hypothetical protein BWZ08_02833 [candidate division BRC1 bacterium ADurb.BinA292]
MGSRPGIGQAGGGAGARRPTASQRRSAAGVPGGCGDGPAAVGRLRGAQCDGRDECRLRAARGPAARRQHDQEEQDPRPTERGNALLGARIGNGDRSLRHHAVARGSGDRPAIRLHHRHQGDAQPAGLPEHPGDGARHRGGAGQESLPADAAVQGDAGAHRQLRAAEREGPRRLPALHLSADSRRQGRREPAVAQTRARGVRDAFDQQCRRRHELRADGAGPSAACV